MLGKLTETDGRRAPRAAIQIDAIVEVRTTLLVGSIEKATYPVLLRDASSSGLSFVAPGGTRGHALLERGARVTLRVPHLGRFLEMPASVVWSVHADGASQPVAAGVRLHPEATDSATRRNYDLWVRQALARYCSKSPSNSSGASRG